MSANPADAHLDVTNDVCPMTFVKTKLELEELAAGRVLEVRVRAGESHDNVRRSSIEDGHAVLADEDAGDGIRRLLIRRG